MEFKGTKGEWELSRRSKYYQYLSGERWDEFARVVVKIEDSYLGCYSEEGIANAKLIAAAPELLEACQKAMSIVELWHSDYSGSDDEGDEFFGERQATLQMKEKIELAINKALK